MEPIKNYFTKGKAKETWKKDLEQTQEDGIDALNNGADAIGKGIVYGLGYFVVAPIATGAATSLLLLKASNWSKDRKKEPRQNNSLRDKLNNSVQNFGNKFAPRLQQWTHYGLGDLLTEEVTLEKTGIILGTAAGYAAPTIFHYNQTHSIPATIITTMFTWPFNGIGGLVGGVAGFGLGKGLDSLLSQTIKYFRSDDESSEGYMKTCRP